MMIVFWALNRSSYHSQIHDVQIPTVQTSDAHYRREGSFVGQNLKSDWVLVDEMYGVTSFDRIPIVYEHERFGEMNMMECDV